MLRSSVVKGGTLCHSRLVRAGESSKANTYYFMWFGFWLSLYFLEIYQYPAVRVYWIRIVMCRMWLRNKLCLERAETRIIAGSFFTLWEGSGQTEVELCDSSGVNQPVAVKHDRQRTSPSAQSMGRKNIHVYALPLNFRNETLSLGSSCVQHTLNSISEAFLSCKRSRWLHWMTSSVQQSHFGPVDGVNKAENHVWCF